MGASIIKFKNKNTQSIKTFIFSNQMALWGTKILLELYMGTFTYNDHPVDV